MATNSKYFAVIIGAGFSGTILASLLARQGRDCLVIDRSQHPRFAIGESSTPTADFLLAYIASRWNVPELKPLACFGTWQQTYPNIQCGLKRGFSYFGHEPGKTYWDDERHSRSLLVAASATDEWSDTHWFRADVDQFLAQLASRCGAQVLEKTNISSCDWHPEQREWTIEYTQHERATTVRATMVRASWLIDASGFGEASSRWCAHHADDDWMRTRSSAVFAHVSNLKSFSEQLPDSHIEIEQCFNADDAAQHHVTEDGWFWMLRFLKNRTSIGFVQGNTKDRFFAPLSNVTTNDDIFKKRIDRYPSIAALMQNAAIIDPKTPDGMPTASAVARMSRCRSHASGPGWILMPVTYGFVDPLHSTGIAHALSGVCRIADTLLSSHSNLSMHDKLSQYTENLRQEVAWFDTLVSGCYQGLPSFERFTAFASFYFVASIAFERQLATDPGYWPNGFMNANDQLMRQAAEDIWAQTLNHAHSKFSAYEQKATIRANLEPMQDFSIPSFIDLVRQAIEPWNSVGLLSESTLNRLQHTAPPKRLAFM